MSSGNNLYIVIEDATKRKWFGNASDRGKSKQEIQKKANAKKQGAGAIKVICGFWREWANGFDNEHKIIISFNKPFPTSTLKQKGIEVDKYGKITMKGFRQLTGYKGKACSQHARDAGVIAFTYNPKLANIKG